MKSYASGQSMGFPLEESVNLTIAMIFEETLREVVKIAS